MPPTIDRWHQLLKTRNPAGLDALLDDSVVFHSPILHCPQEGRELTTMYLTAAFHVLVNDSFRYVREIVGAHDAALEFVVEIDGISINGIDLIQWNSAGRITDFKVMLRPLKAINLVQQKMLAMLQKHQADGAGDDIRYASRISPTTHFKNGADI